MSGHNDDALWIVDQVSAVRVDFVAIPLSASCRFAQAGVDTISILDIVEELSAAKYVARSKALAIASNMRSGHAAVSLLDRMFSLLESYGVQMHGMLLTMV